MKEEYIKYVSNIRTYKVMRQIDTNIIETYIVQLNQKHIKRVKLKKSI